ncbi:type II toxin-antitoxin system RelE/ParE family toxin [Tenacibaculum agarivorans]|uniref:type II toxin-antitoxin system RelE/ParE family toxin n=1 Tax=Tenacibaculum agarivorans TaxID=1908389 RepID=UPI00094BB729|nr:type II toxin-antitoxin system RelE/ParE family toxin [Tenacibaculum agarivorans]
MAKVILRQKAIDDLNDIWDYTFEKWSEEQADKYYITLKIACNGIGENPNIGKEYDGISKNLLGFKSGKHIIFYQIISTKRIQVIRILHERMDLKNRITE